MHARSIFHLLVGDWIVVEEEEEEDRPECFGQETQQMEGIQIAISLTHTSCPANRVFNGQSVKYDCLRGKQVISGLIPLFTKPHPPTYSYLCGPPRAYVVGIIPPNESF